MLNETFSAIFNHCATMAAFAAIWYSARTPIFHQRRATSEGKGKTLTLWMRCCMPNKKWQSCQITPPDSVLSSDTKVDKTVISCNTTFCGCNLLLPTQCLKITEKVPFNIASEASYIYIWVDKSSLKKAKNGQLWRDFKNCSLRSNSVTYQTCHL